ncbi:TRAP transporter TatT component family protein [Oceanobacter sp. 4_MG-2023]|uniref:TRAP transporter TatT component family protein n=1 Tax=Oceanobacter sp. 4_MG-2023 TaxID=3062623 RepID=UPI0027361D47|nr:TRAP transporter TatT component family protein [Oceanobacter sp. 4_MG-2023]MDP2547961.1 TRAP transporter TatT component family protein [Oceanobacter sp. 4_MG-2023]
MKRLTIALAALALSACSVGNLPKNLSRSMMNNDNPEVVAAGAPAYLLLLDALVLTYPHDEDFLLSASQLYGAYSGVFSRDPSQAQRMADKALEYATRGLCEYDDDACEAVELPQDDILTALDRHFDEDDIHVFYAYAAAKAGWIQANSSDWGAIAELGKTKALMQWVANIQPDYDQGTLQVYLGVMETQLPPSLGGRPEIGREHFEKALQYSDGKHLMAKVLYAKQYARLMFDQELHDRLLNEAIAADPEAEGLTLINHLAQSQATELLAESADFFE